MAVLVEAISVVVRRNAIENRYFGGWQRFLSTAPNNTLCTDDDLVRVGFMSPTDVEAFIRKLEKEGLTFTRNRQAVDLVVVDQERGPTIPVEWLEFAHLPLGGTNNKVAACWLFEGPRTAAGVHMSSRQMTIATPEGWRYEDSLSANFKFVANEEMNKKLKFLRHEDDQDVYLDLSTGKEVYAGRIQAYSSFDDWYAEFKAAAGSANPQLQQTDGKSLLDFMDHAPLKKAFRDGVKPRQVALEFAKSFDVRSFGKSR